MAAHLSNPKYPGSWNRTASDLGVAFARARETPSQKQKVVTEYSSSPALWSRPVKSACGESRVWITLRYTVNQRTGWNNKRRYRMLTENVTDSPLPI